MFGFLIKIISGFKKIRSSTQFRLVGLLGSLSHPESLQVIEMYERNENLPSIEMVAKMAKAFEVTVDFLIGEGESASYDKQTVQRIDDIQKMDADTQNVLFNVIDTYIQNFKTKQAFR